MMQLHEAVTQDDLLAGASERAEEEAGNFTLADFSYGDHLIITSRSRQGEERRAAIVTCINYNGNGLVTYGGRSERGMLPTGQGAFAPEEIGTKPFGFYVKVEKTGKRTDPFPKIWSPQPGDRGYDLMC